MPSPFIHLYVITQREITYISTSEGALLLEIAGKPTQEKWPLLSSFASYSAGHSHLSAQYQCKQSFVEHQPLCIRASSGQSRLSKLSKYHALGPSCHGRAVRRFHGPRHSLPASAGLEPRLLFGTTELVRDGLILTTSEPSGYQSTEKFHQTLTEAFSKPPSTLEPSQNVSALFAKASSCAKVGPPDEVTQLDGRSRRFSSTMAPPFFFLFLLVRRAR